jgi:hypothetical protein
MSDKATKTKKPAKKTAKRTAKPETSVLGSLPATRPNRLGRHASAASSSAPTAVAKPKPVAKPKAAAAKPKARTTAPKTRTTARKAAAPATPPRPQAPTPPPPPPPRSGPPSSAPELVTTAVQAAGEIAQIGVGLGVRALKRAAKRLPGV